MIISHNLTAMNAMRQLNIVGNRRSRNTEKLSSGYKINRAADDAAGLAVSEKLRRQIRGLSQAVANVQDGISYAQVADGALDEIDDMLQRIGELSVKASNETLSDDDRAFVDEEVQNLKREMDRVFTTTTFNERKIWNTEDQSRRIIDYEPTQAVKVTRRYKYFDITNENSGILPVDGKITVSAENAGLGFNWRGNDGNDYATNRIGWDEYKASGYSVKASDLFGDSRLFASDGVTPLIDFDYRINPIETASVSDIINTINGIGITVREVSPISIRFEDSFGNPVSLPLNPSVSASLNYSVAYRSEVSMATDAYSFDEGLDGVIEPLAYSGNMVTVPTYSDVATAVNDTTGFSFGFNMAGIGEVTANCNSISYSSGDSSDAMENIFWRWVNRSDGTRYKSTISYKVSSDLSGLMDMLTDGGSTPGILNSVNGGCSNAGGSVSMQFQMTAGGESVGLITISFSILNTDTCETVLDKIKNTFNTSTVLDLYTTDSQESENNGYTYPASEKTNKIDAPVYAATNSLNIQAGSEAGQTIGIMYDALSVNFLRISNTNVRTVEDAHKAIDDVKYAMKLVNSQRSDWGAFQNRLEHTVKNLNNVVENTTSAESAIRDTDMAKAMVDESILNILSQAGTAMLSQANRNPESVLSLLQQ